MTKRKTSLEMFGNIFFILDWDQESGTTCLNCGIWKREKIGLGNCNFGMENCMLSAKQTDIGYEEDD